MKAIAVVLTTVIVVASYVVVHGAEQEKERLPTSWNRCSCSVAPAIKTATESCSSGEHTSNAVLRDCILTKIGVYDGDSYHEDVAEAVIDEFKATDQQKEALKNSLHSCPSQSRNNAEKLRTCAAEVLRRRCLTDPNTVCNKRE